MKLVSVVVLAYRSADTIIETLESIKKQTYPKIELIVTDDCSPIPPRWAGAVTAARLWSISSAQARGQATGCCS